MDEKIRRIVRAEQWFFVEFLSVNVKFCFNDHLSFRCPSELPSVLCTNCLSIISGKVQLLLSLSGIIATPDITSTIIHPTPAPSKPVASCHINISTNRQSELADQGIKANPYFMVWIAFVDSQIDLFECPQFLNFPRVSRVSPGLYRMPYIDPDPHSVQRKLAFHGAFWSFPYSRPKL